MGRLKARMVKRAREDKQAAQSGFWPALCRRVNSGELIPIISNALFIDPIFDIDADGILGISPGEENPLDWSIEEQLADAYAATVNFPLPEQHWLPRVALFDRVVNHKDDRQSKTFWLNWLKESLLIIAEDDEDVDAEILEELKDDIEQNSFSDIAAQIDYPKLSKGQQDPLAQLAKLNLPIYITTSHFDFLEQAIKANGREPITQVCFWANEPLAYVDKGHKTDHKLEPTSENPVVFHLFGHEAYPESMVLHEDDYLDFLSAISRDTGQRDPVLPLYLSKAITKSSLILLGYKLRDWEFRVMFRGIINTTASGLKKFNLAIQLDPSKQKHSIPSSQVRKYLKTYFNSAKSSFDVEWSSSQEFINDLWGAWEKWKR